MASDKKFDLKKHKAEWDQGFAQTSSRIPVVRRSADADFSAFEDSADRSASPSQETARSAQTPGAATGSYRTAATERRREAPAEPPQEKRRDSEEDRKGEAAWPHSSPSVEAPRSEREPSPQAPRETSAPGAQSPSPTSAQKAVQARRQEAPQSAAPQSATPIEKRQVEKRQAAEKPSTLETERNAEESSARDSEAPGRAAAPPEKAARRPSADDEKGSGAVGKPAPKEASPESTGPKATSRAAGRVADAKRKLDKAGAAAPVITMAAAWGELRAPNAQEEKTSTAAAEAPESPEPYLSEPRASAAESGAGAALGPALPEPRESRLASEPARQAASSSRAEESEPHLGKPAQERPTQEEPYLRRPESARTRDAAEDKGDEGVSSRPLEQGSAEAASAGVHVRSTDTPRSSSSGKPIEIRPPIEPPPAIDEREVQDFEYEEREEDAYLTVPPRPLRSALQAPLSRPLLFSAVLLCAVSAATAAFVLLGPETDAVSNLSAALKQQQPEAFREPQQPSSGAEEEAPSIPVQEVEETAPPQPPEAAPEPEVAFAETGETGGMILPEPRPENLSVPATSNEEEEAATAEKEPVPEDGQESAESPNSTTESETAAAAPPESAPASEPEPVQASRGVPTPEEIAAMTGGTIADSSARAGESAIEESAAPTSNNLIATVQRALLWRGYDPGPVDGKEGAKTRAAVRAFQRQLGVPANGEIDVTLLRQLRSVETAPGAEDLGSALHEQRQEPQDTQLASMTAGSTSDVETMADPAELEAAARAEGQPATAPPEGSAQNSPALRESSPIVAEVQRALRLHGYEPGAIDGVAGPQTRSAARAYQRRAGLEMDGEIDAELLQSLNRHDAPALRESAGSSSGSGSAGSSNGLTRRLESAVDSVAKLLGMRRGGEVDPDFARTNGESASR